MILQERCLWYWPLSGCWKVRENLPVRKGEAHEFDLNKFILKKLSQMEVREQDYIQHSNIFAILENSNDSDQRKGAKMQGYRIQTKEM